jgi:hypothetical protein
MTNPYAEQPSKAFWSKTAGSRHFTDIEGWYSKKWPIGDLPVAAAGSCFAQHIGRHLRSSGFNFVDVEPPPPALEKDRWLSYGYNMYSARFGNIYTARQLLQLLQRSMGIFNPSERFWTSGSGFVDPFRPTIEPQPFRTIAELEASRASHLRSVATLFERARVFIFTLGLTEAWVSRSDGAVFPVCPGTRGGVFDPAKYQFVNFAFPEILSDLREFLSLARTINPKLRLLLTVSPVPLVATASDDHVVVATSYSKSVLRAAAGHLYQRSPNVDYFPSYEIISSPAARGMFFGPDLRSVCEAGVSHVMKHFFSEHTIPTEGRPSPEIGGEDASEGDDVICDELLLEAFGRDK